MDTTAAASSGVQDDVQTAQPSSKVEESTVSDQTETSTEDAKNAGSEETQKEEGPLPFHKHPAWQRQVARNRELKSEVSDMKQGLQDALTMLRELKGETPVEDKKDGETDFEVMLKNELSQLADSLDAEGVDLGNEEIKQIEEVSKKYAVEIEGKKVYLPAESAYKIWQDLKNAKTPVKESVNTRPSGRSRETAATDMKNLTTPENRRKESFGEMMGRLKRMAEHTT